MTMNITRDQFTEAATGEIMRLIRANAIDAIERAAAEDGFDGEAYDDGWGWHEASGEDIARLRAYSPDRITELQTVSSDVLFALDAVDTLLGFDDGTHWRLRGWSFYDLVSNLLNLDPVND